MQYQLQPKPNESGMYDVVIHHNGEAIAMQMPPSERMVQVTNFVIKIKEQFVLEVSARKLWKVRQALQKAMPQLGTYWTEEEVTTEERLPPSAQEIEQFAMAMVNEANPRDNWLVDNRGRAMDERLFPQRNPDALWW